MSEISKFELGKFMSFPNFDWESFALRGTCIIILIILHTTHNSVHITHIIIPETHIVVDIIDSNGMRPWNDELVIMTFQK